MNNKINTINGVKLSDINIESLSRQELERLTDDELRALKGERDRRRANIQAQAPISPVDTQTQDLEKMSDRELIALLPEGNRKKQALENLAVKEFKAENPRFNKFDDKTIRQIVARRGEVLGVGRGLKNVGIGSVQLGTALIGQGDSKFAKDLAGVAKRRREEQAQLPTSQRAGVFIGETIPFLGAGVGAGLKVAGTAGKAIGSAVTGAIGGGLSGATQLSSDPTLQGRAKQTAIGTGLGLTTGLATPLVSKAVKPVASLIGKTGKAAGRSISRLIPGDADDVARKTLSTEDLIIKQSLPTTVEGGLDTEKVSEIIKGLKNGVIGPDDPTVLADFSPTLQRLTRSVSKLSGGDVVVDALEGRSASAGERIADQLSRDLGSPNVTIGSTIGDLIEANDKKLIASPIYVKAFKGNPTLPIKGNEKLFEQIAPDIKSSKKSLRISSTENIPDNSLLSLHNAKLELDDKIRGALKDVRGNRAKRLLDIKQELLEKMDEISPDYKKARKIYGDALSIETAYNNGLKYNKSHPSQITKQLKKMTPSERDGYRQGVLEDIYSRIEGTTDSSNAAKKIFNKPILRKRLKAVFDVDSQGNFEKFEKKIMREIQAADTKFKVLGGSRTDFNQESDLLLLQNLRKAVDIAIAPKRLLDDALTTLDNVASGLNKNNANKIANALINNDDAIPILERILANEKNPLQRREIQGLISNLAGVASGNISSDIMNR